MSKVDTLANRKTFRAVLEVVAYIPIKSNKEIPKGINHAIRITTAGRLFVIELLYLKG